MEPHTALSYRFPGQIFPHDQDPSFVLEKLLPPARGWSRNIWSHSDEGFSTRDVTACCLPSSINTQPVQNSEGRDGNAAEMIEFFSRLQIHLVAQFGEQGALIRAHMLFEAYGPVRNVDPKVLISEDANGDSWSGAIDSLKS